MRARVCGGVALVTMMASLAFGAQEAQPPRTMLPVPPLPEIGLPLPHIGLPPAEAPPAPTSAEHSAPNRSPGGRGEHRRPYPVAPVVYVLPQLLVVGPPVADAQPGTSNATVERAPAPVPRVPTGTLTLDIHPAVSAQIFVDRYYVGATDQIGTSVEMPAGPHDIELKADGFEPVRFAVRLGDGQSLTYHEALKASDAVPEPAAPATPVTLYVIAGCYAGSIPPDQSALPPGCDISRLKTLSNR